MTGIDQARPSPESSIAKFECLLQSWNQFLLWDNLRVHYRPTHGRGLLAANAAPMHNGVMWKNSPRVRIENS